MKDLKYDMARMTPFTDFLHHQTVGSNRLTFAELIQKQIEISDVVQGTKVLSASIIKNQAEIALVAKESKAVSDSASF